MMQYRFAGMVVIMLAFLCLASTTAAGTELSVQVRESALRATPSHLGAIVAMTSYGDRVGFLEKRGDWTFVSARKGAHQGWMHGTALTEKRIVLAAGEGDVDLSVAHDEIALAGKGFSEEVETRYRNENRELDYASIDHMEAEKTSPEAIRAFLAEGGLRTAAEGDRP